jgi:hypothetical protein
LNADPWMMVDYVVVLIGSYPESTIPLRDLPRGRVTTL